ELREERALDAFACLVAGPERVAKRLDDMIGGDTDMGRAGLEHLHDGAQHTNDGAEGWILSLHEAAQTVKVPEQLVGAVEEMNDHRITLVGGRWTVDVHGWTRHRVCWPRTPTRGTLMASSLQRPIHARFSSRPRPPPRRGHPSFSARSVVCASANHAGGIRR